MAGEKRLDYGGVESQPEGLDLFLGKVGNIIRLGNRKRLLWKLSLRKIVLG